MARFSVNSRRVMHETIEGEVILIDLTTGSYFSLRDAGAEIWHALEQRAAEDEIVATLAARYDGSDQEIRSGVTEFLGQLSAEGLIEVLDADSDAHASRFATENGIRSREPFSAPVLEKHTDMQDLILLDPVHEVDARGWPHAGKDRPEGG